MGDQAKLSADTCDGLIARQPDLSKHLPVLDGVRGLAILMVLLFHFVGNAHPTDPIERVIVRVTNYGSYGVELFFVLSGFLITGILYDSAHKQHYFRNFYIRRVLRIFPLYYGALILVFFAAPLIPIFQGPTLDYLSDRQAWAWLYGINIYIAKEGDWAFSYLNHFWSLAIEEHFYILWPLIVYALAGKPKILISVSLAMAVSAMSARLIGSLMGVNWWSMYVLTPFRLDSLALGAFLALAIRQRGGLKLLMHILPWVAATAGAVFAVTLVWSQSHAQTLPEAGWLPPVRASSIQILLACILLAVVVAPERTATSQFFSSRILIFFGTYSYGLYVYHHFFSYYLSSNQTEFALANWFGSHLAAIAFQATLGIAASIGLAYVSYEYYEKPFLRLKQRVQS